MELTAGGSRSSTGGLCVGAASVCVLSWPVPPESLPSVLTVKKLRAAGREVTQREGITHSPLVLPEDCVLRRESHVEGRVPPRCSLFERLPVS